MKSLKGKLAWNFLNQKSLWAKYANSRFKVGTRGSSIWNAIRGTVIKLQSRSYWMLGKGEMTVTEFCNFHGAVIPSDCSRLSVREAFSIPNYRSAIMTYLGSLYTPFYTQVTFNEENDRLMWMDSHDGSFCSRKFKESMRSSFGNQVSQGFWSQWITPRTSITVWKVIHNGLPTDDNIEKLKVRDYASACPCCLRHEETRDHLFLQGVWADQLWDLLTRLFGGTKPGDIEELTNVWLSISRKPTFQQCLRVGLVCGGLWHIWRNRNKIVHNERCVPFNKFISSEARNLKLLIQAPVNEKAVKVLKNLHVDCEAQTEELRTWSPGTKFNCLNTAIVEVDGSLRGGAVLRDGEGKFIWGYCAKVRKSTPEEEFLLSLSLTLKKMSEEGLACHVIQSSHPSLNHLNNYYAGSLVFCRKELMKREYGFQECYRICSYLNQAAICLAYLGREGAMFHDRSELPQSFIRILEVDIGANKSCCDGNDCIHPEHFLGNQ